MINCKPVGELFSHVPVMLQLKVQIQRYHAGARSNTCRPLGKAAQMSCTRAAPKQRCCAHRCVVRLLCAQRRADPGGGC